MPTQQYLTGIASMAILALIPAQIHSFELLFRQNQTLLPGTQIKLNSNVFVPEILADELTFAQFFQIEGVSRTFLMSINRDGLSVIFDTADPFPTGGTTLGLAGNAVQGGSLYWGVSKNNEPRDGLILQYRDGRTAFANVPPALQTLGNGSGNFYYSLNGVSADGSTFALTGFDFAFAHFVLRSVNGEVEIIAQESVTRVPGTTETFQTLSAIGISPDGNRIAFTGISESRQGLYLWENGQIVKLVDTLDDFPGTDQKFAFLTNSGRRQFGPDGTFYFLRGTNSSASRPTDRIGYFAYSPEGELTLEFDNRTLVDGLSVENIDGMVMAGDGTVVFYTNSGRRFIRYANGQLETIFVRDLKPYLTTPILTNGEIYLVLSGVAGLGNPVRQLRRVNLATKSTELVHHLGSELINFVPTGVFFTQQGVFLNNASEIWYGDQSELDTSTHVEYVAFTLFGRPDQAPWYEAFGLNWIWATDEYYPWVYSNDAQQWLYLTGTNLNAFWAWHPQNGWFYSSRQGLWPFYYNLQSGWGHW